MREVCTKWMEGGSSGLSLHAYMSAPIHPLKYAQTHTQTSTRSSQGTPGQNKGLGLLTQILKAHLLDLPGLPS